MASSLFSKAVLRGLIDAGYDASAIVSWVGLSPAEVEAFNRPTGRFSDDQILAIERATGRTCGEWALSSEPSVDADFAELMGAWAASAKRPGSAGGVVIDHASAAVDSEPASIESSASRKF